MKNTKLEEQLLIKQLLNLVIYKTLYLVKMCPIFDSSPPVFGARYQSFLRVCWFLHKGVPYFGYPSENLSNQTDVIAYGKNLRNDVFLGYRVIPGLFGGHISHFQGNITFYLNSRFHVDCFSWKILKVVLSKNKVIV